MKQLNKITAIVFLVSIFISAFGIFAPARAELLVESGDWTAFKESDSSGGLCFISSQPSKDVGDYKKRGDIFAIVTFRPQENTVNEVSFQIGYEFKNGEDAIATIDGNKTFKMFTQNESAWTYDKKSDEAMVAAMRAGTSMVVKGISSRGTKTTDTYSLKGFTKALNAAAKACGIK